MNNKVNVRSMAISAIDLISSRQVFSNNIINREIVNISDPKDESLYRELVYGTCENLIYIDYVISKLSKVKIKKMESLVLNALRLGVYELIFLRIGEYATVNEYVKIAKRKKGIKAGNFVNAILRNLSRNLETFSKIEIQDKKKYLSIKYSFNEEIVTYLSQYYDLIELEDILKALSKRPNLSIRVNTNKVSKEKLKNLLALKDIHVYDSKISRDALIVENPFRITGLKEFRDGFFTIQDQGSIKVSEVLDPKENSMILDLCAAPGSKSSHLAQISNDKGFVYANDISKQKLSKIEENMQRLSFKNYKICNYDASKEIDEFVDKFDFVLVDAPCSGLGVIIRKPEIKLFRTMDEIYSLYELQKQILDKAYKYLKKGGFLVYSTCTIGKLENQKIIDYITSKYSDLDLVQVAGQDYLEILPHRSDSDGFFMAKLTKN